MQRINKTSLTRYIEVGELATGNQPEDYLHSSAGFYATGRQGIYEVTSYMALENVDLAKPDLE